jgi:hypothetical protein
MSRKGPIKVAVVEEEETVYHADMDTKIIEMPDKAIVDAGVKVFREYAGLHWPTHSTPDERFKMESFNYKNDYHLRVTLGMVFNAMKAADERGL